MKNFFVRCSGCISALLLLAPLPLHGQECARLKDSQPVDLALYLNDLPDKRGDAACVAFAIEKIGEQRYEPAIPVLTKFLDFRWPVGAQQRQSRAVLDRQGTIYPAAAALERFGQEALPAVVTAMGSRSTSQAGLEAAVSVWMTLHGEDGPLGLTLLKQESANATDPFAQRRIISGAVLIVRDWCTPDQYKQCSAILEPSRASQ